LGKSSKSGGFSVLTGKSTDIQKFILDYTVIGDWIEDIYNKFFGRLDVLRHIKKHIQIFSINLVTTSTLELVKYLSNRAEGV
jgi:hypothetical protein